MRERDSVEARVPADQGGILIDTSKMKAIIEVNVEDRYAIVEPGLINATLSEAVAPEGLFYAPDPSSQTACTIGGNVAENSGGPHCLQVRRDDQPCPRPRPRVARR